LRVALGAPARQRDATLRQLDLALHALQFGLHAAFPIGQGHHALPRRLLAQGALALQRGAPLRQTGGD
jgi:hypothetical protein